MKDSMLDKFMELHREIAAERGDFVLFAVLEREESPGKWDVVLAAPWFGEDKSPALGYVLRMIDSKLSREERAALSRVVLLDPSDAFVVAVNSRFTVTDGSATGIACTTLGDVYVTEGYILRSDANTAAVERRQKPDKRRTAASSRS